MQPLTVWHFIMALRRITSPRNLLTSTQAQSKVKHNSIFNTGTVKYCWDTVTYLLIISLCQSTATYCRGLQATTSTEREAGVHIHCPVIPTFPPQAAKYFLYSSFPGSHFQVDPLSSPSTFRWFSVVPAPYS